MLELFCRAPDGIKLSEGSHLMPIPLDEAVDAKNIRKHANDVMRLSQLLAPEVRVPRAARIGDDLNRFLDRIAGRSFPLSGRSSASPAAVRYA